jgi:hypothetical protein
VGIEILSAVRGIKLAATVFATPAFYLAMSYQIVSQTFRDNFTLHDQFAFLR